MIKYVLGELCDKRKYLDVMFFSSKTQNVCRHMNN